MLLWGNLVPHMVVSRLPVLHCLRGVMTHIVLSSLWQRLRLFYEIFNAKKIQCKDIDGDPLGFCQGAALQTVSYKLMILCKDIDALLHVISLVDWPKHVKSFFFFFLLDPQSCFWPFSGVYDY